MTIYAKLQNARVQLHSMPLKKTGRNTYAKYEYWELDNFLPQTQDIFNKVGLCGVIDFSQPDYARLHIYNTEDDGYITFFCPIAEAGLKGCTPIQSVGAVNTYLTRYLWVQAMCLTENDTVDAVDPKLRNTEAPKPEKIGDLEEAVTQVQATKNIRELLDIWTKVMTKVKAEQAFKDAFTKKRNSFSAYDCIALATTPQELDNFTRGFVLNEEQQSYFDEIYDKLKAAA